MSASSSHPFLFPRTPARCLLQFLPPVSRQRECRGLQGGMVLPSGLALLSALCAACSPHTALVLEKLNSSSQRTLHLVVILVLVLSLCTLLLSSGLTFYNSISNPYQTFLGPVGVYTGSGLGGEYPPGTPLLTGTASGSLSLCCLVPHGNAHDPGGAMEITQTSYLPSCVPGPGIYVCKPTAFMKHLGDRMVLTALVERRAVTCGLGVRC